VRIDLTVNVTGRDGRDIEDRFALRTVGRVVELFAGALRDDGLLASMPPSEPPAAVSGAA